MKTLLGQTAPVEMEVRLLGSVNWGEVWDQISRQADVLNLSSVCLDVDAPAWYEGYHRRWTCPGQSGGPLSVWRVELPLLGHGHIIGRLSVSGSRDQECIAEKLTALSRIVEQAEMLASEISLPAELALRSATAGLSKSAVKSPIAVSL